MAILWHCIRLNYGTIILVNMHSVRRCAERAHKETVFTKILPLASHNGAVFYDASFYALPFFS